MVAQLYELGNTLQLMLGVTLNRPTQRVIYAIRWDLEVSPLSLLYKTAGGFEAVGRTVLGDFRYLNAEGEINCIPASPCEVWASNGFEYQAAKNKTHL